MQSRSSADISYELLHGSPLVLRSFCIFPVVLNAGALSAIFPSTREFQLDQTKWGSERGESPASDRRLNALIV